MIENPNYETQKDEIKLLKNILFEKLTIEEELPEFVLNFEIEPDVNEDPKLSFFTKIKFTAEYPDTEPIIEIDDLSNILASSKLNKLKEEIFQFSKENYGMPMVYQIYEMIKVNYLNFN